MSAPVLIIGIGNPSRGDDALGPMLIERLSAMNLPDVELLTDFQLQVEHALDLAGREVVVFVDASVSAAVPFTFQALSAERGTSHTSHALSPGAVLATCERVGVIPPTQAFVLAIRGSHFELGEATSAPAQAHLDAALKFLLGHLAKPDQAQGVLSSCGGWGYRLDKHLSNVE